MLCGRSTSSCLGIDQRQQCFSETSKLKEGVMLGTQFLEPSRDKFLEASRNKSLEYSRQNFLEPFRKKSLEPSRSNLLEPSKSPRQQLEELLLETSWLAKVLEVSQFQKYIGVEAEEALQSRQRISWSSSSPRALVLFVYSSCQSKFLLVSIFHTCLVFCLFVQYFRVLDSSSRLHQSQISELVPSCLSADYSSF